MVKNLVVLAAAAAFVGTASANLVSNPGFETGDFTGWTVFGDDDFTFVDDGFTRTGDFSGFFGPLTSGGIEQVLTASAGDQIDVSFWMASFFGDIPNAFVVTLDGQVIAAGADFTEFDYTEFTATITTTTNNPVLNFTFTNPPDFFMLDDVSAEIVPTPGAVALLGLGGLLAARRRRN
ncbi:MAG: hypothetical protein H7210_13735 [Pyrinomonadaceae bacterium]|nr:hypothetical protein [Phycisphaerales bacterium]